MKNQVLGFLFLASVGAGLPALSDDQPLFEMPIKIVGTGDNNERRESRPVDLAPSSTYLFSFTARRVGTGSGCVVSGPACVNVDCNIQSAAPIVRQFVFRTPSDQAAGERFHLGGWRMKGEVVFEAALVRPVKAVWRTQGGLTLGHGESIDGNSYVFASRMSDVGRNDSRALYSHTAAFNTQRWCFSGGKHVTYRHAIDGRRLLSGKISLRCSAPLKPGVDVEASADGATWTSLGAFSNAKTATFTLPAALFPAAAVQVRLVGQPDTKLNVDDYSFEGAVDGAPVCVLGTTRYLDAETGAPLKYIRASAYYDDDSGERLAESNGAVIWRTSAACKIPPKRLPPDVAATGEPGLVIRTAANESEAVQLVVSAKEALTGVRVALAGDLVSGNDRLPASAVDVRRVGYVHVTQPTDGVGCRAWWPDPLLPQDASGCQMAMGDTQPFRVRVKPPKGTPKGLYRGTLAVSSSRGTQQIPLTVEVFGFTLPDTMTCETAFGYFPTNIYNYHCLKDEAQRRLVIDKYLQLFADNHITPYNPAPLDPWTVTWKGLEKDPRTATPEFNWAAWDKAIEKAFNVYHFNTLRIYVDGLGGGTFHKRRDPVFMGYPATNELYHVLMGKYLGGIEAHLREKGWLDKAYVYWFDEPDPKDYKFVMNGFNTLKRHAPGLRRMLTEQPEAALLGGPNLWCALTLYLHSPGEAKCRAAGDSFWWYVCCVPKAPYVTEFIDHPGLEMRLWSWQTWKEKVQGLLIWTTTYWTSETAYVDKFQNPYEDPMSWMRGYSTPKGAKRPWGNGDGRLLYPPPAANGYAAAPVLDDPVPSIRLEMLGDGIEDYEYFAMLSRRLAAATPQQKALYEPLLSVPTTVTKSLTDFTTDPAPLEAHRVKLARALEALK